MALAPQRNFARVEPELRAALESFAPPAVPTSAPPDAEPGPAGRVVGVKAAYAITGPGERWFVRKAEAARRDNADADRWLVRPDLDAHVYVIVEELGDAEVDVDTFAGLVEGMVKSAIPGAQVGPTEKIAGDRGRTFHARGVVGGMALEYDYAMFVAGRQAFQVIGFARQEFFAQAKDELKRALESFEPPPAASK
jgi:hypothetical protein